jgi:recombinational DNA repair ATPase RecF
MRIETLTLQNFRNVENRACRFDPRFTVLIGKNGSGKRDLNNFYKRV